MTPFAFPSRLLGELLVEQGLIVPADLDDALAEQRATGRRLGEVLVAKGALTGAQLTRALAAQYGIELDAVKVSSLESSEAPAPWQPLGRLLKLTQQGRLRTFCQRQIPCKIHHQHQDQIVHRTSHRNNSGGSAVDGRLYVRRIDRCVCCHQHGNLDPRDARITRSEGNETIRKCHQGAEHGQP